MTETARERPAETTDALIAHVKRASADRPWKVTLVIGDRSLELRLTNAAADCNCLLTVPHVGEVSVWWQEH